MKSGGLLKRYATERFVWPVRALVILGLIALWEAHGRFVDPTWSSAPSLIAERLVAWVRADLFYNVGVTLSESALGLAIGTPLGVAIGLALGRSPLMAALLRPLIIAFNSIPVIALAPLLIMWFGLGLEPKIVLVAIVVFFLIFFNTFAGAQSVDDDWIATLQLMGAGTDEQFRIVIAPACIAWILSGLKSAIPYSLTAATVGEMMVARAGVGHLITDAASQVDMTGVYAALMILMALGAVMNDLAARCELRLLRWRQRGA